MRRLNSTLLLDLIRREGPASRAELARLSGLAKPTVSSQMAALLRSGVVREQGPGDSNSRGGKRPTLVSFNPECGRLVGVEISAARILVALADMNGEIQERLSVDVPARHEAETVLNLVIRGVRKITDRAWSEKPTVVAVAAPGRVDARLGIVLEAGNVFNWRDVPVREYLEGALEFPVLVENDVNLAALGEMHAGAARGVENFVLIRLTTGIGAGVVHNGRLWQGSHWAAGEIGHMVLDRAENSAAWGARGYLESVVGSDRVVEKAQSTSSAMAALLSGQGLPGALQEALRREDPAAVAILEGLATHLGLATADVAVMFDPEMIVLQGDLFHLVVDRIRQLVERAISWPVRIEISNLGDDVVLQGAIRGARDAANELLAGL
ncbi:MAG TPA: ROK family transcriptional regulator [Paludibaculum sp.]|jgi:predicted NBD/HSP70 family sugar kinase